MFERIPNLLRLCKTAVKISSPIDYNAGSLCNSSLKDILLIQSRTTKILRRFYPVKLYKEGNKPRIGKGNQMYELVENSDLNPEAEMDIVLTSVVPGIGNPGDILTMPRLKAYHSYILPGLAGYPTPENFEYSQSLKKDVVFQEKLVSPSVELCMKYIEKRLFSVVMNKETPWTVEPWHVRCSMRKAGVQVLSDSCVQLPPTPITGPDMDLEGKHFFATITINNKHKVKACCAVHHWSTNIADRLPYKEDFWLNKDDMIFEENNAEEEQGKETQPTS